MLITLVGIVFIASCMAMIYYSNKYKKCKGKYGVSDQEVNIFLSKGIVYTFLTIFMALLFLVLVKVY